MQNQLFKKYSQVFVEEKPIILAQNHNKVVYPLIQRETKEICTCKEVICENSAIFESTKKEIFHFQSLQQIPYVVKIKDTAYSEEIKSSEFQYDETLEKQLQQIVMDNGPNLFEIIQERQLQNRPFNKLELLQLVYSILHIGETLELYNISPKDIKPQHFIFVAKDHTLKVADLGWSSVNQLVIKGEKLTQQDQQKNLLNQNWMSPELRQMHNTVNQYLNKLSEQETESFYVKSNAFQYGLIIYCLATLARGQDQTIANLSMNVTKEKLQDYMEYARKLNGSGKKHVQKIMEGLLAWEPEKRISMTEALKYFNQQYGDMQQLPFEELSQATESGGALSPQIQRNRDEYQYFTDMKQVYDALKKKDQEIQFLKNCISKYEFEYEKKQDLQQQKEPILYQEKYQFNTHKFDKMIEDIKQKQDKIQDLFIQYKTQAAFILKTQISQEKIGPKESATLADAIKLVKNIQKLHIELFYNDIQDKGALFICQSIQTLKSIQKLTLNFYQCDIKQQGVVEIGNCLIELKSTLNDLYLHLGKNKIGDEGAQQLGTSFPQLDVLQKLDLRLYDCKITTKGARILIKGISNIKNLKTIQSLSLRDNGLGIMEKEIRGTLCRFNINELLV